MTFYKKKQKENYGNEKITHLCFYGYQHRSKLERAVCDLIRFRELAGELQHVKHEVSIYLTDARIQYIADFECREVKTGSTIFIEAKGYESPIWPIKKKLYKFYGEHPLEIWGGTHARLARQETIFPRGWK